MKHNCSENGNIFRQTDQLKIFGCQIFGLFWWKFLIKDQTIFVHKEK